MIAWVCTYCTAAISYSEYFKTFFFERAPNRWAHAASLIPAVMDRSGSLRRIRLQSPAVIGWTWKSSHLQPLPVRLTIGEWRLIHRLFDVVAFNKEVVVAEPSWHLSLWLRLCWFSWRRLIDVESDLLPKVFGVTAMCCLQAFSAVCPLWRCTTLD